MAGAVVKGIGWAIKGIFGAASRPITTTALAAGADQLVTGGQGREAVFNYVSDGIENFATERLLNSTGLNMENFENIRRDFEEGDWQGLLSNPLAIAAVALATFGLNTGSGNGIVSSLFSTLLVAGMAYAAQKYLLPSLFDGAAQDPNTPAPAAPAVAPAAPSVAAPGLDISPG